MRLLGETRYLRAVAWMLTELSRRHRLYGLHNAMELSCCHLPMRRRLSIRFLSFWGVVLRGSAFSCHDSRRVWCQERAGARREEKPARAAYAKTPAPWRAETKTVKMAGLAAATEGIEQLDLYYSPTRSFHAMPPLLLFRRLRIHQLGVAAVPRWPVLPLIPASIVVSHYLQQATNGRRFLDCRELKELKLFRAEQGGRRI